MESIFKNRKIEGAFHGNTNYDTKNFLNSIIVEGNTVKEQINSALSKVKNLKKIINLFLKLVVIFF